MDMKQTNQIPGLYDPSFEHDNCGIGACVNIKGVKNHQTVDNALKIVETLEHRAGKDAAGETGDGVGIMLQIAKPVRQRISILEKKENTESECSSSRMMN